jgi:predicted RNA binding protein YcfA (HicA-like mRNA interferase family)
VSRHYPVCSALEVTRVLRRHGFSVVAQKGSYQKRRHLDGWQVIVAVHGAKPIPTGTLKSIIDGSGIAVDEFR